MKRMLVSIVIIAAMLMTSTGLVFAAPSDEAMELPNLKIIVDGKQVKCENIPILVQSNTLLPLREMASILGVPNDDEHIIYNNNDKSVTILNGQTKIVVYIGKLDAFVNDEPYKLKVAPVIYGKGYTYIPFRFIAESLGKKVLWDGSADAILICDIDKFNNIKEIITKSNEAAEKVNKYKISMFIDMQMNSETISTEVDMAIAIDSLVDKADKKMDMQMVMEMLGMQIKTQSYFADNVCYTQVPLTQEWQKKIYLPSEYEMVFNQQSNYEMMQFEDTLCAGLNQIESTDENEILLNGDTFLTELYNNIMNQQSMGEGQESDQKIIVEKCSIEMAIDKNTYLVKGLLMAMKLRQSEINGYNEDVTEDVTIDVLVNYTISDYNGDFEIIIPEEVIETAVEAEGISKLQ